MRYPMVITAKWLADEAGACPKAILKFKRIWPDGARVTVKNYLLGVKKRLPVNWLYCRLPYRKSEQFIKACYRHGAQFEVEYGKWLDKRVNDLISEREFNRELKRLDDEELKKDAEAFVRIWRSCAKKKGKKDGKRKRR